MKFLMFGALLGLLAIVCSDVFHTEDLKDSVDGLTILINQLAKV